MNKHIVGRLIIAGGLMFSAPLWADEGPPDPISIDRASPSITFGNTPGDIYDMLPVPLSGFGWDVGGPGPVVHVADVTYGLATTLPGPADNNDAHSNGELDPFAFQAIYFSGDDDRDVRIGDVSLGLPGTDYANQALLDQAAGDRFMVNGLTTLSPAASMAAGVPAGIAGPVLPGGLGNFPINLLSANQTRYNEIPSIGPGAVNTFAPPAGFTVQDDMDALELTPFDLNGDKVHETPIFFSLDAASPGLMGSPADILVSPPGAAGYTLYAGVGTLGLGPGDELDAVAVWEMNGNLTGDQFTDYAIFSLAPGSPFLNGLDGAPGVAGADDDGVNGVDDLGEVGLGDDLSPADIFVTDFGGANTLFLSAASIGMRLTDNVDALDVEVNILQQPLDQVIPEPASMLLMLIGLTAVGGLRRRHIG